MARLRICAIVGVGLLISMGFSLSGGAEDAVPERPDDESARLLELALDHWLARDIRLQRVTQQISIVGGEFCGERVAPVFGAAVVDFEQLDERLHAPARARFGREHRFYVTAVFPEMAGQVAGLRVADAIIEVNGKKLESVDKFYANLRAGGRYTRLAVARGHEALALDVENIMGCAFPASVVFDDVLNAWATGTSIMVTASYLRRWDDDALLAQMVGHEIAHNALGHARRRSSGNWSSRRNESQADYLGLYLVAMADYPLVAGKWEAMMLEQSIEVFSGRHTHPTSPQRRVAFRKTVAEIERARAAGEPLRPRFE